MEWCIYAEGREENVYEMEHIESDIWKQVMDVK